jgi:hypothetical protein
MRSLLHWSLWLEVEWPSCITGNGQGTLFWQTTRIDIAPPRMRGPSLPSVLLTRASRGAAASNSPNTGHAKNATNTANRTTPSCGSHRSVTRTDRVVRSPGPPHDTASAARRALSERARCQVLSGFRGLTAKPNAQSTTVPRMQRRHHPLPVAVLSMEHHRLGARSSLSWHSTYGHAERSFHRQQHRLPRRQWMR